MPNASRPSSTAASSPPASSAGIAHVCDLLDRVAHKDRQAFARLYDATSAKLYGAVLRILRDRGSADDVLQEAYVKIWQQAAVFDAKRASPITWMVTIARHLAIDELRRQPKGYREPEETLAQTPAEGLSAQDELHQEQDARRLYRCLDTLEDGRQEMVRLAYLEGWSRVDLATHFDQPVNTVKTWLHRALKQLKGCLAS
ncbi:RNA polymerase sigma-70 factor (ECF subfamily) [Onishia taeanensis]|uniref:RNA polymerase sigma-70 factor (ECF subfamily) n=1 Tax=Onishia taeanensis TaxID=284577 RepID=A0A328XYZ6_9GAMM|nr:sigma-70 family RNA polymerase sigma factor [Halomonas taeanensis]RAR62783.1 RNA polymerase sigma-70 factor (ECF subfamily) [Halomonas taeanensis]